MASGRANSVTDPQTRKQSEVGTVTGPRVWVLLGRRYGDNAQAQALAGDLSGDVQKFNLNYNNLRDFPNTLLGASLISLKGASPFVSPWPDLVIGIGRRSVPVARWIRARSGGRARLVQMGRPRLNPRHFDLVITTPQYGVPPGPNVVLLTLPYEATDETVRDADPIRSQGELQGSSRGSGPVLAVLGGNSWAQCLTAATVDALAATALGIAAGAPLVAVSSPRTPTELSARLSAALGPEVPFYDWGREKGAGNPYRSYLAAASRIVMTGDSVSGLADAIWTGRPVTVLPVPEQPWLAVLRRIGGGLARRWLRYGGNLEIGAPPPNMEALYDFLLESGMARREASGLLQIESGRDRLAVERRAVIARVRALVANQ